MSKYKLNKLDAASIKLDIFLQKLGNIIRKSLNILVIMNLFLSPVTFDNKSQFKNDIQEPREIIEIIIKELRLINAIVKFTRKK